jgi:hypothetical protein
LSRRDINPSSSLQFLTVGKLLSVPVLWIIGLVLIVIGAILWIAGAAGREVGGRRHYY